MFTDHIFTLPRIVCRQRTLTIDRHVNKISQVIVNCGFITLDAVVAFRTSFPDYGVDHARPAVDILT